MDDNQDIDCTGLHNLTICSYNCRGYNNSKTVFINNLLSECDILCLQEHWLADSQLPVLGCINNEFQCTGVSGFNDTEVLSGRPYGGCAILWHSSLDVRLDFVDTLSNRVCGMLFSRPNWKLLIITVYMPYEGDYDKTVVFIEQLSCIDSLIEKFSDCHVIICGDFDVDFNRDRHHTDLLDDFCERLNMLPTVRHIACKIDFTYSFDNNRFSILYHFLLSGNLYENAFEDCFVEHKGDNLSDHKPIFLKLQLESRFLKTVERIYAPQLSWCKATDYIYNYTASVEC